MKKLFTTIMFAVCTLASANATDYYVSVNGAGNGDGTSWENAWSLEQFKTEFNVDNSRNEKFIGADVYFANGKYGGAFTLYIRWGLNLHGATTGGRTVFTGDSNNDGVADRDRLFKILTNSKVDRPVTIENIDFENFKLNQVETPDSDNGVGVFSMYKCISTVTLNNCNFKDITNAGHGGSAIFAKRSNIVLNNCTFKNISAKARGVVIRLTSDENNKGTTTLNNCVFEACKATTADKTLPCGLVMLQHGETLTVVNSVFKNNVDSKGLGGALYIGKSASDYKRELIVDNCLMFNNSADNAPAIFFNDDASKSVTYTNCKMDDASAVVMPSINVSSVEAATYYVGAPFTMPVGLKGKAFAAVEDKMLVSETVYEAGEVVPAGTALLIEGAAGTYNPVLAETTEEAPESNLLKGADVTAQTTGGESYYKLAVGDAGLGFYWANPEGATAFESAAHKAYLCLNGDAGARKAFFFSGETTGIEGVNGSNASLGSNGAKVLKDGRLVIEKGGKTYNAVGAEVM